jgi:tRNA pseudouridine55 synthase
MKRRRGIPIDGWLVVDKPRGVLSTEVVNHVKRVFNAQKAGHAGTLDPLATGVLPVALGAATKTVAYVMEGRKVYRFVLRFGEARDTDDADGTLTATSPVRPTDAEIRAALPRFIGDILQVPPVYSAVKVQGERAYDLARAGEEVQLAPRPARIDRFDFLERLDEDRALFEVESGKGVYMRSLARDLAAALGTYGHIETLRRLRVGPFTEKEAIPLDKIQRTEDTGTPPLALLAPVATALADIPALALTGEEGAALRHGQAVSLIGLMGRIPAEADPDGGRVRMLLGGRLLGLGRLEAGWLKPERLLQPGE